MSDLSSYRDTKVPLVARMRAAAADNLLSEELDELLGEFADEVTGWAENARENAGEGEEALESGYDSEDLESAVGALDDIATALIGAAATAA